MVGTVDLVDLIFPGSYTKIVKVSSPEVSYIMWELYPKNWFKKNTQKLKLTARMKLKSQNLVWVIQFLYSSHSRFMFSPRVLSKAVGGVWGSVTGCGWTHPAVGALSLHWYLQIPSRCSWCSWSLTGAALFRLTWVLIDKAISGLVTPFAAFPPHRSHFVASDAFGEHKIVQAKSPST